MQQEVLHAPGAGRPRMRHDSKEEGRLQTGRYTRGPEYICNNIEPGARSLEESSASSALSNSDHQHSSMPKTNGK